MRKGTFLRSRRDGLLKRIADYSETAKPWDTVLYIGKASGEGAFLKASILDHGNTFSAHWINDQLIFVQV